MSPIYHWCVLLCFLAAMPPWIKGGGAAPGAGDFTLKIPPSHNNDPNRTKNEHDLFIALFTTYNKHIRPIDTVGELTRVFFELSLFNLLDINTKRQAITTNSEIIMKWQDDYLIWDPKEYDGLKTVRVPYQDIWYPDIILQNTAAPDYDGGIINTNAIIYYNGEVELTSHAVLTSICIMDIQWYPFDQQTCDLAFASWTFDNAQIQLIKGPADLSEFKSNPEFFLEDFYANLEDHHNPCCPNPMSTITYSIQIQRRTIFSLFFFIMPGILINVCALMVFSLPSESGEKVGLGINSMLAMMVFLMAMTEKLPPTEELPLAGVYYGACITIITLNITFSVAVLNLNVMGMRGYQVPFLLRVSTLFVARMIFVRIPRIVRESWEIDENDQIVRKVEPDDDDGPTEEAVDVNGSLVRVFTVQPQDQNDLKKPKKVEEVKKSYDKMDYSDLNDPFQRRAVRALEAMAGILNREEASSTKTKVRSDLVEEWKFISRVMDRTLFILFSFSAFVFNLSILTSSPFREKFAYCPLDTGCEDLTMKEIIKITANAAANMHFGDEHGDDSGGGHGGGHGDDMGGHGAPAAHHLRGMESEVVALPSNDVAIPSENYTGFEGLGLLAPGSPEAIAFLRREKQVVALMDIEKEESRVKREAEEGEYVDKGSENSNKVSEQGNIGSEHVNKESEHRNIGSEHGNKESEHRNIGSEHGNKVSENSNIGSKNSNKGSENYNKGSEDNYKVSQKYVGKRHKDPADAA